MEFQTKIFFMENETVSPFPLGLYDKLVSGKEGYAVVKFANTRQRFIVASAGLEGQTVVLHGEPSFDLLRFKEDGKVDRDVMLQGLEARVRASIARFKNLPVPQVLERLEADSRWEGTPAILEEVRRQVETPVNLMADVISLDRVRRSKVVSLR